MPIVWKKLDRSKNTDFTFLTNVHFPYECSAHKSLQFHEIHGGDNSLKYRVEIKTQRNDPRLNRHQRVQLQGWRANSDISIMSITIFVWIIIPRMPLNLKL